VAYRGDYRKVPFNDQLIRLSIIGQTPGSIDPIFLWLIGGDNSKVPSDDQLRRSSKMADLTNWGDWRKVSFDDQHRPSFNMSATAAIFDFVSVHYLANAWVNWSDLFVAYWG
jgi:hypothetical protein